MGEGANRTRTDSVVGGGGGGDDDAETLKLLRGIIIDLSRKSSIGGASSGTTRILIPIHGAPARLPIF